MFFRFALMNRHHQERNAPEKCPKADLNCRDCDVRSLAGPEPDRQVFAKFKHLLRKAAGRSAETTCVTIGEILRAFTPNAPPISDPKA
jgi:hypothetical protein